MHAGPAVLLLLASAAGYQPGGTRTFATFGNAQTKALIRSWAPQPIAAPEGTVLTPSSTESMKRFVRARILLEDPSTGCVASFDDSLCLVLTHFCKAEHQLLLPLWPRDAAPGKTFEDLQKWHTDAFNGESRLSGARLEGYDDRAAWAKANGGI